MSAMTQRPFLVPRNAIAINSIRVHFGSWAFQRIKCTKLADRDGMPDPVQKLFIGDDPDWRASSISKRG